MSQGTVNADCKMEFDVKFELANEASMQEADLNENYSAASFTTFVDEKPYDGNKFIPISSHTFICDAVHVNKIGDDYVSVEILPDQIFYKESVSDLANCAVDGQTTPCGSGITLSSAGTSKCCDDDPSRSYIIDTYKSYVTDTGWSFANDTGRTCTNDANMSCVAGTDISSCVTQIERSCATDYITIADEEDSMNEYEPGQDSWRNLEGDLEERNPEEDSRRDPDLSPAKYLKEFKANGDGGKRMQMESQPGCLAGPEVITADDDTPAVYTNQCLLCGRPFKGDQRCAALRSLIGHVKVVHQGSMYSTRCPLCNKSFKGYKRCALKRSLIRHMSSLHSGSVDHLLLKLYRFRVSGSSKNQDNLQDESETVTQQARRFLVQCPVCKKYFTGSRECISRDSVIRHMKRLHPDSMHLVERVGVADTSKSRIQDDEEQDGSRSEACEETEEIDKQNDFFKPGGHSSAETGTHEIAQCPICRITYKGVSGESSLRGHITTKHPRSGVAPSGGKWRKCSLVQSIGKCQKSLSLTDISVACSECNATLSTTSVLQKHINIGETHNKRDPLSPANSLSGDESQEGPLKSKPEDGDEKWSVKQKREPRLSVEQRVGHALQKGLKAQKRAIVHTTQEACTRSNSERGSSLAKTKEKKNVTEVRLCLSCGVTFKGTHCQIMYRAHMRDKHHQFVYLAAIKKLGLKKKAVGLMPRIYRCRECNATRGNWKELKGHIDAAHRRNKNNAALTARGKRRVRSVHQRSEHLISELNGDGVSRLSENPDYSLHDQSEYAPMNLQSSVRYAPVNLQSCRFIVQCPVCNKTFTGSQEWSLRNSAIRHLKSLHPQSMHLVLKVNSLRLSNTTPTSGIKPLKVASVDIALNSIALKAKAMPSAITPTRACDTGKQKLQTSNESKTTSSNAAAKHQVQKKHFCSACGFSVQCWKPHIASKGHKVNSAEEAINRSNVQGHFRCLIDGVTNVYSSRNDQALLLHPVIQMSRNHADVQVSVHHSAQTALQHPVIQKSLYHLEMLKSLQHQNIQSLQHPSIQSLQYPNIQSLQHLDIQSLEHQNIQSLQYPDVQKSLHRPDIQTSLHQLAIAELQQALPEAQETAIKKAVKSSQMAQCCVCRKSLKEGSGRFSQHMKTHHPSHQGCSTCLAWSAKELESASDLQLHTWQNEFNKFVESENLETLQSDKNVVLPQEENDSEKHSSEVSIGHTQKPGAFSGLEKRGAISCRKKPGAINPLETTVGQTENVSRMETPRGGISGRPVCLAANVTEGFISPLPLRGNLKTKFRLSTFHDVYYPGASQCSECEASFSSEFCLQQHANKSHRIRSAAEESKTLRKTGVTPQPWRCSECPKWFISSSGLQQHVRCMHTKPRKESRFKNLPLPPVSDAVIVQLNKLQRQVEVLQKSYEFDEAPRRKWNFVQQKYAS